MPLLLQTPLPYHNLPQPTYLRLVGREQELAWLRARLSPTDRSWQIAIMGIGGVGKTALALAVAHEYVQKYADLPPELRFDAIIWVSAKEEVLTVQGRAPASLPGQILHTLEDIYRIIAQVLEREDITRALPEEQDHVVQKVLRRQRTLLIIDNLESVKDERVRTFLYNLPEPSKAIITTRDRIETPAMWKLTGLSWEDTRTLIDEEGATRGVRLAEEQCFRIFELTQGLPLPIKLAVARLAGDESFDAVTRWLGDATGDIPEYCVAGQIALARERNPVAWHMIVACSLFDREAGASDECLGIIVNVSRFDRDRAITDLLRLFLINRGENERFWTPPIVQRFVESALASEPSLGWIVDRWLNWLMSIAQDYGSKYDNDMESRRIIRLEFQNLCIGIRWCQERELLPELSRLCEGAWAHAYWTGLFSELEDILRKWLYAAEQGGCVLAEGRACLQLARLEYIREMKGRADELLDRAEPILRDHHAYPELIELLATKSQILRARGQRELADSLTSSTYEISQLTSDIGAKIAAMLQMAHMESRNRNFDSASQWLERAEYLARDLPVPHAMTMILSRRGRNLIEQGKYAEAELLFNDSVELNRRLGQRRYLAFDLRRLAQIYAETGRPEAARQAAEEALDLFERLGMPGRVAKVKQILDSLPAKPA